MKFRLTLDWLESRENPSVPIVDPVPLPPPPVNGGPPVPAPTPAPTPAPLPGPVLPPGNPNG
ncbi:MAG: hypothetical protein ACRCZF_16130 [Gemmataceae bacterium]